MKRKEIDSKEDLTIARALTIDIERPGVEIKTNFFHSELNLKTTRKKNNNEEKKKKYIHDEERSFDDPLLGLEILFNLSHHLEEESSKEWLLLNYCQHDCSVDLSLVVLNKYPPKHRYLRIS